MTGQELVDVPDATVPGGIIRKFSDERIQTAIEAASVNIPEGHKFAAMGYIRSDGTAGVVAVVKLGKKFSASVAGGKESGKTWAGEAAVLYSPF